MLTNLFYYDFYKPYIFKNEKLTSKYPKYQKTSQEEKINNNSIINDSITNDSNEYSFFLNKAFKNEIVNYAETISIDLNSIKNFAKNVINNADNTYFNFDTKKDELKKELKGFIEKYNSYKNFAQINDRQSPLLSNFSDNLKFVVENNVLVLSKFGVDYDEEDNGIFFDEDYFDSLDIKIFSSNIEGIKEFCEEIYDGACEIMSVPMEEHMNFRNLNYYYNYIFSNEKHNTVKIIETGMLVDISL